MQEVSLNVLLLQLANLALFETTTGIELMKSDTMTRCLPMLYVGLINTVHCKS